MAKLDLVGKKFGALTVVERSENSASGRTRWLCRCDCGGSVVKIGSNLLQREGRKRRQYCSTECYAQAKKKYLNPLERSRAYRARDREKINHKKRRLRAEKPDQYRTPIEKQRAANYKKYGMTIAQFDAMFSAQDGRCAICRETSATRLCIDHDHATGRVRKLLCHSCNVGLSRFRDNPALLEKAAEYIRDSLP
jgi:hypothetical protein